MILAEWHVGPDQLDEWTDERLVVFLRSRNERIRRMNPEHENTKPVKRVSDLELFAAMGVTPNLVN